MRIRTSLILIGLIILSVSSATASTITFIPNPPDMYDLDHNSYYKWGLNWIIPDGEEIVSASLLLHNIADWQTESNVLYIHMIHPLSWDVPMDTRGVLRVYSDSQEIGDHYKAYPLLVKYQDLPVIPQDLTYDFTAEQIGLLTSYLSDEDHKFAIGFDPDCHYFNDGISLTIETQAVPEPGGLALCGVGLLILVGIRPLAKAHSSGD